MTIFKLLRVHQYVKNFFILFPLFFAAKFQEVELLQSVGLAFLFFSLGASSIYILNDYLDREADRLHPTKCKRPIASGKISPAMALLIAILCVTSAVSGMYFIDLNAFYALLGYLVLNLFYSVKLKHIPIVDISCIAIGFVIRLLVGANAGQVPLSHWILIMTFLLALFLGLAKRRDDVLLYERSQTKARKAIEGYNLEFLGSTMMVMSSVTIVSYLLYCVSPEIRSKPGHENLYVTTFFVVVGIMRYMQLTFVFEASGSPTRLLLKDRFLQVVIFLWLATFGWIIY